MKLKPANPRASIIKRALRAFTLAEVLAAMMFMAIVIPVAVQAMRVASMAGEVGQRKAVAARIGNKILNELKVTGQLQTSAQNGVVKMGGVDYKWSVRNQLWTEDTLSPMNLVTLTVAYSVQGKSYDVHLSTLLPQTVR